MYQSLQNGIPKETEQSEGFLCEFDEPTEEVGVKYDQGKPRLDLIPSEALIELGKVLEYGARKYAVANWAKGIPYSRLIAAAMRHLAAYNAGQDIDPESGLSHISHAMCNLSFLIFNISNRNDLDDRWVKSVK